MEHTHPGTSGTRDCGTFFLDVVGQFSPQQLKVTWSDEKRPSSEEVDQLIEKSWAEQVERAKQRNIHLFNGKLCRLIDYHVEDNCLQLVLGHVSFKEFVGTNATQAYLRYIHGPTILADPLGVSAALCTTDGFIVLGMRSNRVAQYPQRVHPIGGTVEPADKNPDPFATMLAELEEETAIPTSQAAEILCLGMVRDRNTVQPELIFDLKINTDVTTLFEKHCQACDAHEHASLVPVRDHPASVVTFLEQQFSQLTPIALATLLLHGLKHWGSGWFANARGYLRSVI